MQVEDYRPRIADKLLAEHLSAFGAVCVEGPMWCGKTWTSMRQAASVCPIGDSADNFATRRRVEMDIQHAFDGPEPRLIDEWQIVPAIWDATRSQVDMKHGHGRFILTGSATPPRKGVHHSGTGRISRFRMRPMSLWESGASEGTVSLETVCANEPVGVVSNRRPELREIIELVLRGGWPESVGSPFEQAVRVPASYVRSLLDRKMPGVDESRHNRHKMELLLRSLARNESTSVGIATLRRDISGGEGIAMDEVTLSSFLDSVGRLFVTENIPPFSPSIRSGVRVKQSEKRRFCDPSIAAALLKATPPKLERDLNTLGFLFESLVLRDLLCYAESFGASVFHYRDYENREADAVVELPDGEWAAIEVKLGLNQEESAARNLLDLRRRIAEKGGHPPQTLAVVVGLSGAAYRRQDGVYVLPITALKP